MNISKYIKILMFSSLIFSYIPNTNAYQLYAPLSFKDQKSQDPSLESIKEEITKQLTTIGQIYGFEKFGFFNYALSRSLAKFGYEESYITDLMELESLITAYQNGEDIDWYIVPNLSGNRKIADYVNRISDVVYKEAKEAWKQDLSKIREKWNIELKPAGIMRAKIRYPDDWTDAGSYDSYHVIDLSDDTNLGTIYVGKLSPPLANNHIYRQGDLQEEIEKIFSVPRSHLLKLLESYEAYKQERKDLKEKWGIFFGVRGKCDENGEILFLHTAIRRNPDGSVLHGPLTEINIGKALAYRQDCIVLSANREKAYNYGDIKEAVLNDKTVLIELINARRKLKKNISLLKVIEKVGLFPGKSLLRLEELINNRF